MCRALIAALTALLYVAAGTAALQTLAQDKPPAKEDAPPVRLSSTANGMGLRLAFAVKDLTPEQKTKSIPILQELDKEYGPIRAAKEKEHREELENAARTRTPIDLKESSLRTQLWSRRMYKVENKYEDRLRDEVLTEKQRPVWDAYRLHFASAFQLSFTGIGKEGAEKLAPICEQVVKDIPLKPGEKDGWGLFQRRLVEVKERAAKQIMNDEQRKKYAELKAGRAENDRKLDDLERGQDAAKRIAAPPAAEGDGLE